MRRVVKRMWDDCVDIGHRDYPVRAYSLHISLLLFLCDAICRIRRDICALHTICLGATENDRMVASRLGKLCIPGTVLCMQLA